MTDVVKTLLESGVLGAVTLVAIAFAWRTYRDQKAAAARALAAMARAIESERERAAAAERHAEQSIALIRELAMTLDSLDESIRESKGS